MPFYDRACPACHARAIDVLEPIHASDPPCPTCATPMIRTWFTTSATVIRDEIWHTQVNGFKTPRKFYSKAERRRALKEAGWVEQNTHIPSPGSDKSSHTTNWAATGGTKWLQDAEALAKGHHNGEFTGHDPVPDATIHFRPTNMDTGE